MTEAALFYEMAHANLGEDFLDDIKFAIDAARERPKLGVDLGRGFRRMLVRRVNGYKSRSDKRRPPSRNTSSCWQKLRRIMPVSAPSL